MTEPDRPGIYLHLPYCAAICPYCDFAVKVGRDDERRSFVDALVGSVEALAAGRVAPEDEAPRNAIRGLAAGDHGLFDTIYLGGGTPSLIPPDDLARLLVALRRHLPVAPECRLHLEANPEDVDAASLATWREMGVEFLSLGVQSLDDGELAFLGRHHDAGQARRSIETALAAGFDTVSVDLIYGLPGQTRGCWDRTLDEIAALAPPHLSCYELEIHPKTVFGVRHRRGQLAPMPEDGQADLFLRTHERLAELGWAGYELSNFARSPEHRSRHNAKYWRHVPYLGLGPSAHGYAGGVRWWNVRQAGPWMRRVTAGESGVEGWERLGPGELAFEAAMLGLRTADGVDLAAVRERWGVDLEAANAEVFARWERDGLARRQGSRLRPTVRGMAVADRLAAELA